MSPPGEDVDTGAFAAEGADGLAGERPAKKGLLSFWMSKELSAMKPALLPLHMIEPREYSGVRVLVRV